jgi:GT2 family glycosyltransferase
MQNIYLSIIIVSYNTKDITRNCLSSIYQNPPLQTFEIIVVDNNSSDKSQDTIEREFPGVILVKNSENVGFARASNQGIRISRGEYILILNSDTLIFPGALDRLSAFMEQEPDAGAITPKTWLDEGKTLQCNILSPRTLGYFMFVHSSLGRIFPRNLVSKKIWAKDIKVWLSKYPLEVDCFDVSCIMVRRQVLKDVGLLDENFFMYFDELDWCLRIKKAGWKLFLVPDAEIVHLRGQSPTKGIPEIYRHSLDYYLKKHYRWPVRFFLNIFFLFSTALMKILSYFNVGSVKERVTPDPQSSKCIHWPEIKNTKGYILEISINPAFTVKGASLVGGNSYKIPPGISLRWRNGIFFWRVAPIYNNGNIGEFSAIESFKVK